jgi:hypothetical protein
MVKNLATAVAFLFVATIANAEDGVKFGARYGYSFQRFGEGDYNDAFGMVISGGFVASIPAGPIVIAPELAFIYRAYNYFYGRLFSKEMAISIPVVLKFFPTEGLFLQSGVQFDFPFDSEFSKRASVDIGIPMGLGYMVTPNFGIDFRYVLGLTPWTKQDFDTSSSSTIGLGLNYFF